MVRLSDSAVALVQGEKTRRRINIPHRKLTFFDTFSSLVSSSHKWDGMKMIEPDKWKKPTTARFANTPKQKKLTLEEMEKIVIPITDKYKRAHGGRLAPPDWVNEQLRERGYAFRIGVEEDCNPAVELDQSPNVTFNNFTIEDHTGCGGQYKFGVSRFQGDKQQICYQQWNIRRTKFYAAKS